MTGATVILVAAAALASVTGCGQATKPAAAGPARQQAGPIGHLAGALFPPR